jgi:hypothetical protein
MVNLRIFDVFSGGVTAWTMVETGDLVVDRPRSHLLPEFMTLPSIRAIRHKPHNRRLRATAAGRSPRIDRATARRYA